MNSLPTYVAESPDTMPCMRLYDGDLRPLMLAFDKLSERQEKNGGGSRSHIEGRHYSKRCSINKCAKFV